MSSDANKGHVKTTLDGCGGWGKLSNLEWWGGQADCIASTKVRDKITQNTPGEIENQAGFSKEQEAQVQLIQKLSNLDDTVRGGIKDLLDITWSGEEDKQTATA